MFTFNILSSYGIFSQKSKTEDPNNSKVSPVSCETHNKYVIKDDRDNIDITHTHIYIRA